MKNTQKFNTRAFVSTCLFLLIIILFLSAVMIQVLETITEEMEVIPSYLSVTIHFITAVHGLTGFIFSGITTIHVIKNWKTLKNYFNVKSNNINKEIIFAFVLIVVICLLGLLISLVMF
jgi:hypothetical protein